MGGGRSDRRETAPAAPIMAGAMEPGDDEGAQRERELALLEEAAHILAAAPQPDDVYPVIVRLAALIGATAERHWRASYLSLEGGVLRRIAVHDEAEIDLGSREYPLDERDRGPLGAGGGEHLHPGAAAAPPLSPTH